MTKEKRNQLAAHAQMVRAELSACQATARSSDDWRDIEEVAARLNKAVNAYVLAFTAK